MVGFGADSRSAVKYMVFGMSAKVVFGAGGSLALGFR